jgi:hypothetical protein
MCATVPATGLAAILGASLMKLLLCLGFGLLLATACSSRTSSRPPASRVEKVTETLHGVPVSDDYRWLEGDNSDPKQAGKVTPEVAAWTDAQMRTRGQFWTPCPAGPRSRSASAR